MLNKPWRVLKSDTIASDCKIFGNNQEIEVYQRVPEWNQNKFPPESESCFDYKGNVYFLSEFMRVDKNNPFHVVEKGKQLFDGYHGDSFFSGILVKYSDGTEAVKAYTYIS